MTEPLTPDEERELRAATLHDLIEDAYEDGCDHSRELVRPWQCRAWADRLAARAGIDVERAGEQWARAMMDALPGRLPYFRALLDEHPDSFVPVLMDAARALLAAEYVKGDDRA